MQKIKTALKTKIALNQKILDSNQNRIIPKIALIKSH